MKLLPVLIMVLCIRQLNAQDTIPQITLEGHQYTVFCIDFSEDNKYLGSGGWDNTVKIWDFKNSKEVRSFNYHEDMIRDVCFSPDNTMIASASRDNTIRVTNLSNGEKTIITNQYEPTIEDYYRNTYFTSIAFTPQNDKLLFTLAGRNEIFIWDIVHNSLSEKILGPESGIRKLELSDNGQFVAGISGDNTVIVWDMTTKKEIAELKDHIGQLATVCFSEDNKYLVSGGGVNVSGRKPIEHYNLRIWDLSTGKMTSELSGHVDCVLKVKFTPDGKYLSSASEDNSVRVWEINTAKQIWKYEADCYFLSCSITSDGKYLAASSRDETIKIWDLNKIIK